MSNSPPDSPEAWLERARSDLALARVALGTEDVHAADACFHAQPCAERALKAHLIHLGTPFPRTHVLDYLVDLVKDGGIDVPLTLDEATQLTQYAVETRYPGAWEPVEDVEASVAIIQATAVLTWVEDQLTME